MSDETCAGFCSTWQWNCNAASVCISSGSWIPSSMRKIDFAAIFVLNLIQHKPHRASMLLYDTIWRLSMRLSVWFGVMRPKPNELKFSPVMGGRARVWFMLSSPQWIAYLSTRFLPAVSSGTQRSRNAITRSLILLITHTTIRAKVKEFWEVAKEETVMECKKLGVGSPWLLTNGQGTRDIILWGNTRYYLTVNMLFLRTDFITLGIIRVWSIQKADTLLKLVTLRLEDFTSIWNDIVAITTNGDGIMLNLGRLVQCEHIVCLLQNLYLLGGDVLYEKCSHRTMQDTKYKSVTTNMHIHKVKQKWPQQ